MLHNPRWSQPSRPESTLEGLIEWLERQPGEGAYEWFECSGDCLIGQFMTATGNDWLEGVLNYSTFVNTFDETTGVCIQSIAAELPHTFGAALLRARAALRLRDTHATTLERAIARALTVRID